MQRYKIPFKDNVNNAYEVRVFIEGYVGPVTELTGTRSAFVVTGTDEDFVYEPLRTSSATLTILDNRLLLDLFSINNQYAPVKLYKGDKLMWTGYITPEQFTQPYLPTPDSISIDCISAMGTLENIKYEQQTESGFITAWALLRRIVSSANGGYESVYIPHVYASSLDGYNSDENIFEKINLAEENFTSDDLMLNEVLEYLCRFLNWTCYDYEGSLYFVDADWSGEYMVYNEGMTTYEKVMLNEVNLQNIGFAGTDHTIDILPGYSKATVKSVNNTFDELLDDEEFSVNEMYDSYRIINDEYEGEEYVQGLMLKLWKTIAYGNDGALSDDAMKLMGARLNHAMTGGMTAYRIGRAEIEMTGGDVFNPEYRVISENYDWRTVLRYRIVSTAVGNPILKVCGKTAIFKEGAIGLSADILFTTNYAEPHKVTITESHVLRFSLRIGENYWNGNGWQKSSITFDVGIGEIGKEVERTGLRTTKTADMPYEGLKGYIIEFPSDTPLIGELELIMYGVDYPYQMDKRIKIVDIENVNINYKKKDGVIDEGEDGDRIYENVVNERFMSELDEIEFGIGSYNEDGATYSKALLNGSFLTDNLYSAIEEKPVRPEEALIRRIISRYQATKIKLTQNIKNSELIHPFTVLSDKSMVNKKFMMLSGEWDYEQNRLQLMMVENGERY